MATKHPTRLQPQRKKSKSLEKSDGENIQGFAPSKFLTGSAVYSVSAGTVWQASDATDFAYEAGAAVVMPAVIGANYVIPNGVDELHLSSAAVVIAFAGYAAAGESTKITSQPFSAAGQVTDEGVVVLVGEMVSDIAIEASGESLVYQWFFGYEELAGQAAATLTGTGRTLESGEYRCQVTGTNGVVKSIPIEVFAHNGEFELTIGEGLDVAGNPLFGFRIIQSIAAGGIFDEPQIGELTPRAWPFASQFARLSCGQLPNNDIALQAFGSDVNQFANATELTLTSDGIMPDLILTWLAPSDRYTVVDLAFADYLRDNNGLTDSFVITPTSFT